MFAETCRLTGVFSTVITICTVLQVTWGPRVVKMYQNYFKKILDFSLAVLCLIFFLPLMMIIYLILLILIGSPVFIHKRPGFNNKIFHLYKFKTIIDKDCKASLKKKKFF